jgi:multidrug efflux pump
VQVRAEYPGANPKVIAETVATPLEEAINGVENMMYMKSVAGSDGVLVTTVTFRPGTDPDQAQVQVQNRVAQAEARLPEDAASGHYHPETVAHADAGGASVFAKR